MNNHGREIVLVTGGSGFLGQHIIRELQKAEDLNIAEIRIIDKKDFINNLDYMIRVPIITFIRDICDKSSLEEAFYGVTCVIHSAALVSYDYPTDWDCLNENNVRGTQNIVELCREYDVSKLVFTSTAEVSFVPCLGFTSISIIINQTEVRANPKPRKITGYAASKLEAEKIVLEANDSKTKNGCLLKTVSLRPPLIYGEGDNGGMMTLLKISCWLGGVIPRIAGTGGKQQIIYAGNAAWSHVCAMKILQQEFMNEIISNRNISGLPVFITDDTTIADCTRLCEKLTTLKTDRKPVLKQSWWTIPILLSLILAIVIQFMSKVTRIRVNFSPCALIIYLGSLIFFNRLRASICLEYSPIYNEEVSLSSSAEYYRKAYRLMVKKNVVSEKIRSMLQL